MPIRQDYSPTAAAMLHPGSTTALPHHREAPIKITLSFQTPEAALPLGRWQAADPVAAIAPFLSRIERPLVQFGGEWTVRMEESMRCG